VITLSPPDLTDTRPPSGTPPTVSVDLNAIMDALRPLGVRDLPLPMSSERLWQVIDQADQRQARP
jgi:hypothetical protein